MKAHPGLSYLSFKIRVVVGVMHLHVNGEFPRAMLLDIILGLPLHAVSHRPGRKRGVRHHTEPGSLYRRRR